ncbi:MAG: carboxylating nicotinate-nucleotide diphosphorylase [Candidatus Thorarchaeota archaeon]|nr:carboxylating nicotinate-nucleotide diphosphorylase [Candidatus Thorarchaeota archaeon]
MMNRPSPAVMKALKEYLEEDIRSGDLTTKAIGQPKTLGTGTIFARSKSILAGAIEIAAIAEITGLACEVLADEGKWVGPDEPVIRLKGPAGTLLTVERVCLNIIMRMSGIATKVHRMMETAREGNPALVVAATRKTTPGFRYFEKRAVQVGGGDPHRYALDDMVLIKNNHITVVGGVGKAITAARGAVSFSKKISCEVRNLKEAMEAVETGADIVLLDNFKPEDIVKVNDALTKKGWREKVILEASGGIDESNVKDYAQSGVDIVSSGALTHSYDASNFNMRLTFA